MSSAEMPPRPCARYAATGSSLYVVFVALTCVVLIVSNIAATKGIEIGSGSLTLGPVQVWPLVVDGGAFLFPLAYIVGDVISEVYGFKAARRAILLGFATTVLATLTFWIVEQLPGASWYQGQAAYESVVGPVAQVVLASVCAFLAGNLLNALVVVRLKARTAERGLVGRLIASSVAGQSVDTIVFCTLAASAIGATSPSVFVNYVVVGIVFKLAVEAVVMPVTVIVINAVKRREPSYARM